MSRPTPLRLQQRHVVLAGQQAHVVHLRHAGQEELDGARDQVGAIVAAQRVVEGAVHLVQVEVAGGRAGGLAALAAAVGVDHLHQLVELGRRHQARAAGAVGRRRRRCR
jgi:hypothetical protein